MSNETTASVPPARILVIDDEPQIRRFLDISLRSQGYSVELAENGQGGLDALATHGADLVILDQNMPKLTGTECLQKIKMTLRLMHIPVIMYSTGGDVSDRMSAQRFGAFKYLIKPKSLQESKAVIRDIVHEVSAHLANS